MGYPEVIILDEPTVGLDPKQIIEIRDLIRKLGEKHTVILSSHILSEVSAVCDHIMIISHGKLVASDSPEGLQKLQNTKRQLTVSIKGEKESVQNVISNIKNINTFKVESGKEKGSVDAVIETETGIDIREELFYALAEKKLPILEMQLSEKSLEDIFLELTQDERPASKSTKTDEEVVEKEELQEEEENDSNL